MVSDAEGPLVESVLRSGLDRRPSFAQFNGCPDNISGTSWRTSQQDSGLCSVVATATA